MSKSVDGEFWKAIRTGMEDAVKDVNRHAAIRPDDQITMTFEGASNEQDVEKQINTLDAVIAENPTSIVFQQEMRIPARAQIEAAEGKWNFSSCF